MNTFHWFCGWKSTKVDFLGCKLLGTAVVALYLLSEQPNDHPRPLSHLLKAADNFIVCMLDIWYSVKHL